MDNEKIQRIKELKNLENSQLQIKEKDTNNILYYPHISEIKKSNFNKITKGIIFRKIVKFKKNFIII